MNNNVFNENLQVILSKPARSEIWLSHSFGKCRDINTREQLSDTQFGNLEAFASRFARASGLLIQKTFRAIDAAEFETSGTIIDSVNRAEKRGLINDVNELREIRELRNRISHEYASDKLIPLLEGIRVKIPVLKEIIQTPISYCQEKHQTN